MVSMEALPAYQLDWQKAEGTSFGKLWIDLFRWQ
jgi:hypothetical protein